MKLLIIILFLLISYSSYADSWPSPELKSTISPDSSIIVRIIPGEGFIDISGKDNNKPKARAEYYKWVESFGYELYQSIELVNLATPIYSLIMNDGSLVTVDNWYSTGSGKVVVIYSPEGVVIKSYELNELFPKKEEYNKLGRSVSSIQWRCPEPHIWLKSVMVPHTLGGHFSINVSTGEIKNIKTGKLCE